MTVVKLQGRKELAVLARIIPAVVALALLSGCVVVPAYGPGPGYYRNGYYSSGYYYPYYYRDRDDYYRRW